MYLSISDKMAELSNGYKNELEFLLRSQQTDLKPFIENQIVLRSMSFQDTVSFQRFGIVNYFEQLSNLAYENIMSELDSLKTIDELKKFTKIQLWDICYNELQKIMIDAEKYYGCVCEWFIDKMVEFAKSFDELFSDLDILKVDFENKEFNIPVFPAINTQNLAEATKYVSDQLSKENKSYFGGAAAGAALGTAIAPGIGTAIGGLIGLVGGSMLSPNVDEVKKITKEKLNASLKSYFGDVAYKATKGFDDYATQIENCIPDEINRYLTTYQETVLEQIKKEKEKNTAIEEKIALLKTGMDKISKRKFAMQSLSDQLNMLCGKEN